MNNINTPDYYNSVVGDKTNQENSAKNMPKTNLDTEHGDDNNGIKFHSSNGCVLSAKSLRPKKPKVSENMEVKIEEVTYGSVLDSPSLNITTQVTESVVQNCNENTTEDDLDTGKYFRAYTR